VGGPESVKDLMKGRFSGEVNRESQEQNLDHP
jgi:hypothetical protein